MPEGQDIANLCQDVKCRLAAGKFKACENDICYAMYLHPHAPEPHNLMGILLEKQGRHLDAMKHFRAALDLDPTYLPARENLMAFGQFGMPRRESCYCMEDCEEAI